MRVYGVVSSYVIDVMGKAVMAEDMKRTNQIYYQVISGTDMSEMT
jgi:hypothetical protein